MASFAKDLWDAFEKVVARVELQLTASRDYVGFFTKRHKAEAEYAKLLLEASRAPAGNSKAPAVQRLEHTLRDALLAAGEQQQRLGQRHADAAKRLLEELVRPWEQFLKTSETDKKRVASEGEKKLKQLRDAINACQKTHDTYEKTATEADAARETKSKADTELAVAPQNKKFQQAAAKAEQTSKKLSDKVVILEGQYQAAVKAANELQTRVYGEDMPRLLTDLQKIYEDAFHFAERMLALFVEIHAALPGEYAAIAEALETKMKKELSFEADISEFISATKTDKAGPVPIKYLPHGKPAEEELDSTAPAPAPAASSSSPVAEEAAEAPVEAAVSAGTEAAPFAVPEESAAEKE